MFLSYTRARVQDMYVCVCVYVYIDFPEIGIDAYAGRRLIVEQLLVNAPLFPFSVRSAR